MSKPKYAKFPMHVNRVVPPYKNLKEAIYKKKINLKLISAASGIKYKRLIQQLSGGLPFYQIECDAIIKVLNSIKGEENVIYNYDMLFANEPFYDTQHSIDRLPNRTLKSYIDSVRQEKELTRNPDFNLEESYQVLDSYGVLGRKLREKDFI